MSEKRSAYKAILILGIVSLLGDIVYEGSRGLIPDYLRHLGASALVVGSIIGLGELVSYLSRPISGVIADKFRSYWPLVFLGYGLIASLPMMGMAEMIGGWFLASTLIIVERLGKGIRTPARDTIISFVSKSIGSGKAFGLHELLDQVGAVLGPMTLAAVIGIGYGYLFTFLLLLIPYIALMFSLYLAKKSLGKYVTHPNNSSEREENSERHSLKKDLLDLRTVGYITAVVLNTVGLFPVSLMLYQASIVAEKGYLGMWFVPMLYSFIQLVDAPLALISGLVYDKIGFKVLLVSFTASALVAPLASSGDFVSLLVASIIFGFILGTKESVYRAAITELSPPSIRATTYGFLNTVTGAASLAAGVIYGYFLDSKVPVIMIATFAIMIQLAGLIILYYGVLRKSNNVRT